MAIRQTWPKSGSVKACDDYERRMRNWQRWRLQNRRALILGNSPLAHTMLSSGIYNRTDPRQREALMPLLLGEAEDTERAVQSLSFEWRRAVEVFYIEQGSLHKKARLCGCRRERLQELLEQARPKILSAIEAIRRQSERSSQAARTIRDPG